MKLFLLSGLVAVAAGQLVHHPNGAVTPYDPANAAATAAHLATKAYPYHYGYPYVYGKRSAEADPLVYHVNGAVTPFDPANAAATAAHLASKGYGHYAYAGYPYVYGKRSAEADPQLITYANGAVVPADYNNLAATSAHLASHGYAHFGYPYVYGKRSAEAEADPQLLYAAPYALPYAYVVPGLVAHPNGAVVPVEPADVVKARADHLAAVAAES